MARFTRPVEAATHGVITPYLLPMKGSGNRAFVEMGFRWRSDFDLKERLRPVVPPEGFTLEETDGGLLAIVDAAGYPRSIISDPTGKTPLIHPIKRFQPDVEETKDGWRMLVREWDTVLVRGGVFKTGAGGFRASVEWLKENKPGWSSYISRVNFRGDPPKWKLFG
ncbi:MAG: hypothetical protein ACYTCN_05555 [Planctomycetota bacterium]|jgi:hypothetical protein